MHILHISDIHAQINNYQTKRMRRKLLDKISELNTEQSFDYILLSGDITHQGQDFTDSHIEMIQEILDSIKIGTEKLLIVPGNHDLTRNPSRTELINNVLTSTVPTPSDFLDFTLLEQKDLNILLSSFEKFNEFYTKLKGEYYPLKEIHSIVDLNHCYLILINTCLLANESGEEGKLLIAKDKLFDCFEELSNKDNKPVIAMGHHTLECFTSSEKQAILNLFDDYGVNIYLSGHVHQAGYSYEANNYNNLLTVVCSGVHFDGYTIGGFVDIKINSSDAYITQYLWNSEHEYWTKNNSLGRRMESGTLIHKFKDEDKGNTIAIPLVNRRKELNSELEGLFSENELTFKQYGPKSILAQQKPFSEAAYIWRQKAVSIIIPNNDRILDLLENNKDLIADSKKHILQTYKSHVDGFKNNHLSEFKSQDIPLFPIEVYNILNEENL
ncbi:Calcineurin-like phosphoesterase [Peribacillus simplex]|uniref:Calcineurin-like phosphoesterase n=1 Tax=Peribacillus simplex TaxID=1478 RepID=A0A9X8WLH2_9BACI|nr:metallophosphoesterase [Peribacillus simplex]SIR68701.1 Calcineurin-like phosphoesterase [Peribacillus simplex]